MIKTATISHCGKFRYRLARRWGDGDTLLFVMLNPSTADANEDDATIRRCIRFAKDHGYEGLEVVNLYAYRATKPEDLRRAHYPAGPDNDQHIIEAAKAAHRVCIAWGANVKELCRAGEVLTLLRGIGVAPYCLRITRSGYPQHPLMLASACRLMPFTIKAIDDAMKGTKP